MSFHGWYITIQTFLLALEAHLAFLKKKTTNIICIICVLEKYCSAFKLLIYFDAGGGTHVRGRKLIKIA